MKTWTDLKGVEWRVPQIKGRLKSSIPLHRRLREFVIERDDRKCRWCGISESDAGPSGLVADHIVSRRNGGTHHPDNLQALCQPCNSRKVGLVDARGEAS